MIIVLSEGRDMLPNLISSKLFNDRKKQTSSFCEKIRRLVVDEFYSSENCFCIYSKLIEVCCVAQGCRCCGKCI